MKKVEIKKRAKRNAAKNNLKKGIQNAEGKASKIIYKESVGLGAKFINLADSTTTYLKASRKYIKTGMLRTADMLEGRVISAINSAARALRA